MPNDLPKFDPVLNRLFSTKTLGSNFLENCVLVALNFLWVSSPSLHTLTRETFASFSYHTYLGRWGKYQGRVKSESVLNFSTWSSLRHSKQPLHHDPSAFSRVVLSGKFVEAGIERDRSGLVENTVPFDIRKFRKFNWNFWSASTQKSNKWSNFLQPVVAALIWA